MIETIASEPGGFGYAIGTLGFTCARQFPDGAEAYDHEDGLHRLVCYPADGDRAELIGWHDRAAAVAVWKITFGGGTPQPIALATIAAAVGPREGPWFVLGDRVAPRGWESSPYHRAGLNVFATVVETKPIVGSKPARQQFRAEGADWCGGGSMWNHSDGYVAGPNTP